MHSRAYTYTHALTRIHSYTCTCEHTLTHIHSRAYTHAHAWWSGLGFGADPDFALWVDDAFENGSSGKSATFGNDRLSSTGSFGCLSIEVWKLVY